MKSIHRIVTLSSTPTVVGPRVSQWANGFQPYAEQGVHVQVRKVRDEITVEAVEAADGRLVAKGSNIVSLSHEMQLVAMRESFRPQAERILAGVRSKSAVVREVARERGLPHTDLRLVA